MGKNTTDHILSVAEQLIYKEGVIGFKFCSVAKEAGISTTTLYKLFSNKEDILVALAFRCFDGSKSKKWWLELEADGLTKVIAFYIFQLNTLNSLPFYSSLSTLTCNPLIADRASRPQTNKHNKNAYAFWETPIALLQQAREQGLCQLNDIAITRLCTLLSTTIRGQHLISFAEVGKICSEDADLSAEWMIEFYFKQMGFKHFEINVAIEDAKLLILQYGLKG
ncbi:TetR/AcrR family transcriptional regulator [Shewanella sp. NIFS-20-20]|uniref:TetR/AcrR family transcriptional regulator n=1 Tax=Shewanella sp. NIFS-20-20 TaxID=2853806 RepID=UPI001C4493C7|nr:TetR/AcrR family transcriptional regulator [Shewanella sp. NIFS-20-20]MBV7317458.1 TetR/AcrR family transcriptional regulator [Shewanella sp. NIFS-20-20]